MGVPTLTLAGNSVYARTGLSLLTAIGMQDWVSEDEQDYLGKALAHAGDRTGLATLRSSLRQRVADSPLCDISGFVSALETQYRLMWGEWCARQGAT
jgi:predicted O-linked N-acetylglucosamine transferase (SPINDLY family)